MSASLGSVAAVRVGRVQVYDWAGRLVPSGCAKEPVDGAIRIGELGLPGDEQADMVNHGGPDKAVLLYARHHYPSWRADGLDLPEGAFFENLTLDAPATDERSVRLGDTWRIGDATVQVSQPRNPCYKLARRWGVDDLVERVHRTGRSGWYVRVLEPGDVTAGSPVVLLDRVDGEPSIAEISRVLHVDKRDDDGARRLLRSRLLLDNTRSKLERRLTARVAQVARAAAGPAE
ncbi:MAG: MOSC domain-containing protein [Arachnia sp.]